MSLHGGNLEGYDFHGLEVMQSMVESRAGGETGIKEVEFFDGDRLWKAADEGRWSPELADAARATDPDPRGPARCERSSSRADSSGRRFMASS